MHLNILNFESVTNNTNYYKFFIIYVSFCTQHKEPRDLARDVLPQNITLRVKKIAFYKTKRFLSTLHHQRSTH
jgi:hypothetical protein